jgi:hypothetical protein
VSAYASKQVEFLLVGEMSIVLKEIYTSSAGLRVIDGSKTSQIYGDLVIRVRSYIGLGGYPVIELGNKDTGVFVVGYKLILDFENKSFRLETSEGYEGCSGFFTVLGFEPVYPVDNK